MKKLFTLLSLLLAFTMGYSQSTTVVISQVYSGGGSGSATVTYKYDYIELHNISSVSQPLDGFSLQYASATGNFTSVYVIPAGTSIPAGGYLLVQSGTAGTAGADLPLTPNITANLNLAAASGKLALASQTAALGCGATATICTLPSASVIDLVSWGSVSNAEGGTANAVPALSITTGAVRKANGCTDTDNNLADFDVVTAPVPRNASSAASFCGAAVATLSASPNITNLNTTVGVASASQSYNLSGNNLTGFPGNITVTSSANLEISLNSTTGFATTPINVPYSSATLAATPVYVRVSASAPLGAISGTVTNSGGGTASNAVVTVNGNVLGAEPTVQATNVLISNIGNNGFDVNWTNGDGSNRVVTVRQTSATEIAPVDGTTYTVPTSTGTGNTVVFSGTGSGPVTVTGLTAGTNYTVKVYEGNSTNYLTPNATGNPASASTTGVSPVLTQVNFTGVSVPLYMAFAEVAGPPVVNTRVPVLFFATVSNLTPNTTYRYYTQGSSSATDFGLSQTGAGNALLFDYTASPVTYSYSSGVSLSTTNNYGKFTTNASGSFTGAFAIVPTNNTRFSPGNAVYPSIAVGLDVASPAVLNRFALDQSITSLGFAVTSGPNDGSFIKGTSLATPGNAVALWKSVDGNSLVTARPLSMTLAENPTIAGAAWGVNFAPGYDQTTGSWNTIIPNDNPEGVRLIQQFNIVSGQPVGCNSDADGTWPSGASTSDPINGSAAADAIQITVTDAPINAGACFGVLPVSLVSFSAQKANRTVVLKWSTSQELNTRSFVIERSTDNRTWNTIATVAAAGNSSITRNYTYTDNVPAKGINYYRLKQVDMDYRAVTSAVRPVLFSEQYAISVAPNPATDFINVYIAKNDQKTTEVIIADINGKVIEKIVTADQLLSISTNRYAKGVYFVKVITDEQTTTQKVIVQ